MIIIIIPPVPVKLEGKRTTPEYTLNMYLSGPEYLA